MIYSVSQVQATSCKTYGVAMKVNILVKHPRSDLSPTVLYKSSYLHYSSITLHYDSGFFATSRTRNRGIVLKIGRHDIDG